MAKIVKQKPEETTSIEPEVEQPSQESTIESIAEEVVPVKEETLPEEVVFDVPVTEILPEETISQGQTISQTVQASEVWGASPANEIEFLKKILQIQQEGCFGRHLDAMINERIKILQGNVS